MNQRLAKLNIEGWGHNVTVANDGSEAVEAYKARDFDVILMDLQMPKLSGFEASSAIRKLEKMRGIKRTPILALSANVLKGVRDECVKSGMDGYVSKPVRQPELLSAMAQLIPHLFVDKAAGAAYVAAHAVKTNGQATSAVFGTSAADAVPAPAPAPANTPRRSSASATAASRSSRSSAKSPRSAKAPNGSTKAFSRGTVCSRWC